MPRTLPKIYERMIQKLDPIHVDKAMLLLQTLWLSTRPLTVAEAIDVIATDVKRGCFDPNDRIINHEDLSVICPGLITVTEDAQIKDGGLDRRGLVGAANEQSSHVEQERGAKAKLVRLSHYSVKQYFAGLCASQILPSIGADKFGYDLRHAFSVQAASKAVVLSCLIYLKELESLPAEAVSESNPYASKGSGFRSWLNFVFDEKRGSASRDSILQELPWGKHASEHCFKYATHVQEDEAVARLLAGLFLSHEAFTRCLCLFDPDEVSIRHIPLLQPKFEPSPLYYASFAGLYPVVSELCRSTNVNTIGGHSGTPLQAAAFQGHKEVVRLLLDRGAGMASAWGLFGTALEAASQRGHKDTVQLLLERGADVNAQYGVYGTALQAASEGGHKDVVRMLLKHGADVNARFGRLGTALQTASYEGHADIVQLLIDRGANVNAQDGFDEESTYGTALQAASFAGHAEIVDKLLHFGADPNIESGNYGTALQASSLAGHEQIVRLLLDWNADADILGGDYGSALQAASSEGHMEIAQVLLDRGADVNAHDNAHENAYCSGEHGTALHAACYEGHLEVVELLILRGANINTRSSQYGSALIAAASGGSEDMCQLLIDKGAELNCIDEDYKTALQAALDNGNEAAAQLLQCAATKLVGPLKFQQYVSFKELLGRQQLGNSLSRLNSKAGTE